MGRQYYMRNVEKEVVELERGSEYREVWMEAAKEMNPVRWAEVSHTLCGGNCRRGEIGCDAGWEANHPSRCRGD